MKLEIVPSNRFRKDLKIAKKRGMDLHKLEVVVEMLALQMPLAAYYLRNPMTKQCIKIFIKANSMINQCFPDTMTTGCQEITVPFGNAT